MGVTVEKILSLARHYVGYREKDHSWADMESFLADAGDGNYQRFELLATGGNGSQWCQYFIDALFIGRGIRGFRVISARILLVRVQWELIIISIVLSKTMAILL